MKEVLQDERTVILTDEELWTLVNYQLKDYHKISLPTFRAWQSTTNRRSVETTEGISEKEAAEFREIIAYARVQQKMNLTGEVMDKDNKNQWGATWILERKWKDLKKEPLIQLESNPSINISAGDKEAQGMIEAMLNGETIDISHEDVKNKEIGDGNI